MDGLIQNWLLEPKAFDLVKSGHLILDGYLQGLGFVVPDGPAPQRRTAAKEDKLASV